MGAYISLRACECTAAANFFFLRREHCGRPLYENGGKGGAGAHASANLHRATRHPAQTTTHTWRAVLAVMSRRARRSSIFLSFAAICAWESSARISSSSRTRWMSAACLGLLSLSENTKQARVNERPNREGGWVAACSPTRWRGAGVRRGNEKRAAGPETPRTPRTQPRGGGNQGSGEGNQRAQAGLVPGTMPKR